MTRHVISATKQAGQFGHLPVLVPLLEHIPNDPTVPRLLPTLLRSGTAVQSDRPGPSGSTGTVQQPDPVQPTVPAAIPPGSAAETAAATTAVPAAATAAAVHSTVRTARELRPPQ